MESPSVATTSKPPFPGGDKPQPRSPKVPGLKVKILSSDNDIHYAYKTIGLIGEDQLGVSFEVEDVKNPPARLAMKVYDKSKCENGPLSSDSLRLYKEMLILNKILPKHKNIVEIKDFLISKRKVYVCSELYSRSATMDDFFECADNTIGRRVFQQLCEVVRFIHRYGVVHLDLRPDNILFSDENFMQCKITEFGYSGYNPNSATVVHNEFMANFWFMSEELNSDTVRRGTALDDIKALGRILHSILCGRNVATVSNTDQEIAINNNHPPRKGNFDDEAYDLLKKIGPRPYGPGEDDKFPSMDTICYHPWIRPGDVNASLLNDLNEKLSENWGNLTVMANFMISGGVPLRILKSDSEIDELYPKLGNLPTHSQESRLLEVVDNKNNNRLAMKVVVRKGTPSTVKNATRYPARDAFNILTKVVIMWRVLPRHEHIIELKAVLVSRDFAYFLTPLCERKTLADFVLVARNNTAKHIFRQLAQTVRFMHQHGVVHMDLRLEHVLFRDMELREIEITNFSRSTYVAELARSSHNGFKGSKWFGPEYMQVASKYGRVTADVRALGRILHAMICGNSDPGLEFLELIQNRGITFEDAAYNLLFKIGPSPIGPAEDRKLFSMEQICSHEWLAP